MWRHLRSVLALPVVVTIVIPALLLDRAALGLAAGIPLPWRAAAIGAGALAIAAGLALVVRTVTLFATDGDGTLAPWDPPRRLVVRGPYRHVRNPMMVGVIAILAGEALLLGSRAVATWATVFVAVNAALMPLYEEPRLLRRFGEPYRAYCRAVPRWIPRWRAYRDEERG